MFNQLIERNRVPHALLLAGQSTPRIEEEAQKLAGRLSSGPDIFEYRPEGKMALHPIEKMRELRDEVYLPPYLNAKKLFVIYEADKMLPQAANALLKTFEEPSSYSILILTTARREKILPTILSRCQTFWVPGAPEPTPLSPLVEEFLANGKYQDSRPFFSRIKKIAAEYDELEDPLALQQAVEELFRALEERHPARARFIDEARLKLSRSTALSALLESLFIKLGYL